MRSLWTERTSGILDTARVVAKRKYSLLILLTMLLLALPSQAIAGGWWQIDASDTVGNGVWSAQEDNSTYGSPHGGFSSTSNLCKTCHAVHMAGESSYKMLKDGTTDETRTQGEWNVIASAPTGKGNRRATECMYCHDATSGATSKKPYELAILPGETVRGEHTLGATAIPDSGVNNIGSETGILGRRDPAAGQGRVLQCWQCHSVHGANTIGSTNAVEGNVYDASDAVESWNTKILRLDPANDGSVLAKGSGGLSAAVWQGELDTDGAAVRTGFCADCHNLNPNWEIDSDDTTRPNNRSHPQGPGTDSLMEVYGTTKAVAAHPLERMGCRGCHFATVGDSGNGVSRFPHQSRGWKLLFDEATMTGGTSDLAGDPQRIIPGMDTICLSCHAVFEDLMLASGTGLCLNCHDSKYGAPDIGDEIRKQIAGLLGMGITDITRDHSSEQGVAADFSAPDNRHVECYDCHDAQSIYPWEDTPLTGMWGIEIAGAESWNTTPTLQVTTQVSSQEELCFKCHSTSSAWNVTLPNSKLYADANGTTIATENKAFAFNAKNSSFHPVRAQGRNQSNALKWQLERATSQTVNKLDTTTTIKWTDCHNSDELSGVQGPADNYIGEAASGPHGSENTATLRETYLTSVAANDLPATPMTKAKVAQNAALCYLCHDIEKHLGPSSSIETTYATNFSKNGNKNLHYVHLLEIGEDPGGGEDPEVAATPVCPACHSNAHSNQEAANA